MHSFIERLEPRIAPAALAGNVVNYTDIDGDAVTITFATRGTLQASDFVFEASDFAENGPQQLDAILIPKGHKWKGTDLSAVATAGGEGDGEVHIRRIDARGVDLGNVFVDGDLGAIRAGDHRRGTFAVETLDIATWGGNAIASTALDQSPTSRLNGGADQLLINGDIDRVDVEVRGYVDRVEIGGSILGGDDHDSGFLLFRRLIGAVNIGGDVIGGRGSYSGGIFSYDGIGSVTLEGSMQGGSGQFSGGIDAVDSIGKSWIGGSIRGGSGDFSGKFEARNLLLDLTVEGSIEGGAGEVSGFIAGGEIGRVFVKGDVTGGTGYYSANIYSNRGGDMIEVGGSVRGGQNQYSGNITVFGGLNSARIGGDLLGGSGANSGTLSAELGANTVTIVGSVIAGTGLESGGVEAGYIGLLEVWGDVIGTPENRVSINAFGRPQAGFFNLGFVEIHGSVFFTDILAGSDPASPYKGATIGTVYVSGDWTGSNVVASVIDKAGNGFGNSDDAAATGSKKNTQISSINHIIIAGMVHGTSDVTTDHFGFTAQQLKSVVLGGVPFGLQSGAGNDLLVQVPNVGTGDVRFNEVR